MARLRLSTGAISREFPSTSMFFGNLSSLHEVDPVYITSCSDDPLHYKSCRRYVILLFAQYFALSTLVPLSYLSSSEQTGPRYQAVFAVQTITNCKPG
jgi:hypothetical protein